METTSDHRPALRPWALLFLTLGALAFSACRSKSEPPKSEGPALDAIDAGPPPGVSLLQRTPSRVALDWQFDTRADPFRGWRGRWIAVRIPKDAHVAAIALKVDAPMRASVWRDGTKAKEVSLAGRSTIPIDGPGGDYRLEALGPPSTISDLDVVGQPGAERVSVAKLPVVRFGSLDAGERLDGPWPQLGAYCEKRGGDRCSEVAERPRFPSRAPFEGIGIASGADGDWLAIRTKRGWFVIRGTRRVDEASVRIEAPEAGAPFLRFEHVEHSGDEDRGAVFAEAKRWLVVCRVVDDWPDCGERYVLGTWSGPSDAGPPRQWNEWTEWNDPKTPRALADGGIFVP